MVCPFSSKSRFCGRERETSPVNDASLSNNTGRKCKEGRTSKTRILKVGAHKDFFQSEISLGPAYKMRLLFCRAFFLASDLTCVIAPLPCTGSSKGRVLILLPLILAGSQTELLPPSFSHITSSTNDTSAEEEEEEPHCDLIERGGKKNEWLLD